MLLEERDLVAVGKPNCVLASRAYEPADRPKPGAPLDQGVVADWASKSEVDRT